MTHSFLYENFSNWFIRCYMMKHKVKVSISMYLFKKIIFKYKYNKRFWNHNRYFTYVFVCICIYLCMYICTCTCVCVLCVNLFFIFLLISSDYPFSNKKYFLDIEIGKKEIVRKKMWEIALKSLLTHNHSFVSVFFLSLLNIFIYISQNSC